MAAGHGQKADSPWSAEVEDDFWGTVETSLSSGRHTSYTPWGDYTFKSDYDSEEKFVDMPMFENIKTSNSTGSSKISYTLSGEAFFTYLQAKLDPLTSPSARREYIAPLELHFNVAGEELTKYIEINNGSGGLNDIRPEYSNVEGGLGIFSRYCDRFSFFYQYYFSKR